MDNTAPTISIGAPSASYAAGGPVTYTVTYADANFNSSTLAAGQHHPGRDRNGQRHDQQRHRLGPDLHGHHQQHHGQRYAGDFDRRRHRLGPGRQPGPGRGPSATFMVDNTAPTISIGTPSASYAAGGPVTYTVTYADANFNSSSLAAGQHHPGRDRDRQRHDQPSPARA